VGPVLVNETLAQTLCGLRDFVGELLDHSRMKIVEVPQDRLVRLVKPMVLRLLAPPPAEEPVIVRPLRCRA
jgi:hypothetical protein